MSYTITSNIPIIGGFTIKVDDLKKDYTTTEWLKTLNPKPHTMRNYLASLQFFTDWVGRTPEELLLEAEEEIRSGKLMRQRNTKKYLIGFRAHLQDKGLAPTTVKGHMTGVKSFYTLYDIELPTLPRQENRARTLEKNNKIPTKEDLQEVLKICDRLERAVLLVGASSGLSANEIINLKIADLNYDEKSEITTLTLERGKTGTHFTTFLTPEASKAVFDYIAYRNRTIKSGKTERLLRLEKQKVSSKDNFLFVRRHIPDKFLKSRDEEDRRFDTDAFMKIYKFISEKAQKNTPFGDWNIIRSHNIRKYFNSTMLNAGADSFKVEFFMGHQLDATRAAYFRATPEKLKEIYKEYIPYLTVVSEAISIIESPEWRDLKDENTRLKALAEKYFVDGLELINAKSEVRKLQIQLMPEEERNKARTDDIIKFVVDMKPENESQRRFKEEMKKIFNL